MEQMKTGFVTAGAARLYFEQGGAGQNLVMLHAGVADHRQWNAAFEHFADSYRVLRYDMRGFGRSEPVAGSYRNIDDLEAVLDACDVQGPAIMMGCSMGGGLALDFTIAHPRAVVALIMVCSGPSGLKIDVPEPPKFSQVEQAEQDGDLDRVCELETQIWFDGESRSPDDVDPLQRALLYEMNRTALEHESKGLGERQFDVQPAAYKRLDEIDVPVLVVAGELDLAYTHAAARYMCSNIRRVQHVDIPGTAHLPSMEQPQRFNQIVDAFLEKDGRPAA
jgi:pimeloyl-ACP methyl ester carboxylesterase